jgi:DNA-binding MarR family transcriptional regulator
MAFPLFRLDKRSIVEHNWRSGIERFKYKSMQDFSKEKAGKGPHHMDKEDFRILRLMGEIDRDGTYSQRELSKRLNISVGLVNTFMKRLVNKGYFKVKTMPRNRLKYFLTPEGLARKSRLTAEYLRYSVNFYKDIKHLILNKYHEMADKEVTKILFYGAGEVAELAYLYLQLTGIRLVGIIDEQKAGKNFFSHVISGLERVREDDWDMILVTLLDDSDGAIEALVSGGVDHHRIVTV